MLIDHFEHRTDIVLRNRFWNAAAARIFVTGKWSERLSHARALLVGFASQNRGDSTAESAPLHAVVAVAIAHHQRSEVGVAESERSENVRVFRNLPDWITRIIDHDLLRGAVNAHRGLESLDIDLALRCRQFKKI